MENAKRALHRGTWPKHRIPQPLIYNLFELRSLPSPKRDHHLLPAFVATSVNTTHGNIRDTKHSACLVFAIENSGLSGIRRFRMQI